MKPTSILAAGLALALPLSSQAGHYGRVSYHSSSLPTAYMFGGIGVTEFDFGSDEYAYSFGDGSQDDLTINSDSTGARLGFGLPISEEIAFEFAYVSLGELSSGAFSDGSQSSNGGFSAGPVRVEGDIHGAALGLRLSSPMSEPVGAFARLGLYAWEFDGTLQDSVQRGRFTVEGTDPYVGLGLRMAMSKTADVQLSYDFYPLESDDNEVDFSADAVSLDFVLRF